MARYQKVARLSDSVFVTGLGMEAFMQHIRKQEVISAVKKAFQRAYSMSLSYTPSQAPATVATASPLNIRVFMVAFMVKYYPNTLDRTDDELVQAFQARSTEITAIFDQLSAQLQMQGKWTNSAILQQFPYKVRLSFIACGR
jgi:asparagine synthetase A